MTRDKRNIQINNFLMSMTTYDAQCRKKALMHFADKVGPDQYAHPCSLIWTFSVCRHLVQYPLILLAGNEGPDQPALMRRLIWACIVCKMHKGPFCALCIISFHGQIKKLSIIWMGKKPYLELSLRKHTYSNILKILPPKNESFQIKKYLIFFIFLFKI